MLAKRSWTPLVSNLTRYNITILTIIGIADPGSVELTNDEVIALVEHFGFKVESKESGIKAGYIQDDESMLQNTYQVSHWVARKL